MTYEQFWYGDPQLAVYYRKAADIKRDLENQKAWMQGAYIYEAIIDVSPILNPFAQKGTKPIPYRTEPYDFAKKSVEKQANKQEKAMEKTRSFMEAFMISNNKRFEKEGGEMNG